MRSEIAAKASFEGIRYAQVWEDADVLVMALAQSPSPGGYAAALSREGRGQKGACRTLLFQPSPLAGEGGEAQPSQVRGEPQIQGYPGATLVSICSAGDNALAMLTLDPARVVAVDLSAAQIACLEARVAAYRTLDHAAFLELMGSRPSWRRGALFDAILPAMPAPARAFWSARRADVLAFGLGGVGKFERYFRLFRRWLLPLVHSRQTVAAVSVSRPRAQRAAFLAGRWNNWRWRLLLRAFFSRQAMGRLGRDPAFFDHVEGSVADHVARRIRHAAIDLDPAENPYLHWILHGTHGEALPLAWRAEHYATIRSRLDRLDIRHGSFESLIAEGVRADGFNLSDIFEYIAPEAFAEVYGRLLAAANPGARLVYWNMMAPRRMPPAFAGRVRRLPDVEEMGKAADKAFFYSDFVVEEVAE